MTSLEKAEIKRLPKRYKPLGAWGYFWHSVLYSIPVIGWIALLITAISGKNIVARSYARSYFVALLVALIMVAVGIALVIVAGIDLQSLMDGLSTDLPNQT